MAKKYLDYDGLLYFWGKLKEKFLTDVSYNSTSKKIQKTKNGSTTDVVTLSTVATSGSYNDLSNKPTIPAGVEKTSTTPLMDGTAAIGSETKYAAGDHVHPHDTTKVDKVTGKGLSTNDYTTNEKNKLAGIAAGAEVNQNAFSNVKVGADTVAADSKTDTLELVAGTDISLTPDTANDKVTIAFNGTIPSGADEISFTDSTQSWQGYDNVTNVEGALVAIGEELTDFGSTYIEESQKGAANGVAPLNASSKIDSQYLPSYVDDVIEAYPRSGQTELSQNWLSLTSGGSALTPEAGKIYVLMADSTTYAANSQFRWGGTAYVKLSDGGVSSITNAEIDTIVAS